jgi:hypothetical protein
LLPVAKKLLDVEETSTNHNEIRDDISNTSDEAIELFSNIESTQSYPLSWISRKSSFFFETLNNFLLKAEEHGFTQYFIDSQFIDLHPKVNPDPKILTNQMLSAGFIVWLASVAIACIVFVIEHIVAYKTRSRSSLKVVKIRNK